MYALSKMLFGLFLIGYFSCNAFSGVFLIFIYGAFYCYFAISKKSKDVAFFVFGLTKTMTSERYQGSS